MIAVIVDALAAGPVFLLEAGTFFPFVVTDVFGSVVVVIVMIGGGGHRDGLVRKKTESRGAPPIKRMR